MFAGIIPDICYPLLQVIFGLCTIAHFPGNIALVINIVNICASSIALLQLINHICTITKKNDSVSTNPNHNFFYKLLYALL